MEPTELFDLVRFGDDFELDVRAHVLRRAGRVVRLERIPFDVLALLVEHAGQLVTRDQIVEKIWGKGVFLDTDNSINGAIRKIRQVLKDDSEQPRFIQTVTGSGYRFIAPLVNPGAAQASPPPERPLVPLAPPPTNVPAIVPAPSRRWVAASLVVALVAVSGVWLLVSRGVRPLTSTGRVMLAVLPFDNLTGDAAQEYFSDGLTEELITQLGRLDPRRLGLISRTSVMRYKHGAAQVAEIGRVLGVQYVLEGSVRRDPNRVRIAVQLIHVRDQSHVWAREYDREQKDLLTVQGEIAEAVADEIRLTLGEPRASRRIPANAFSSSAYEAYDLYLKGRYFWNKRTAQGFEQAIESFQQAIGSDPGYAPAYAGLADAYALLGIYNAGIPQGEIIAKSRAAALKALQLDDGLAAAHTSLALINEQYDWNWQTAEHEFRRAIELNANYVTAHQWYGQCLAFEGRFDEALAESERARQLDPLSLIIAADHGAILYYSRQYDRAIQQFRAVLAMEPNFQRAHMILQAYEQKGQWADAIAHIENWRRMDEGPWTWAWAAHAYGWAGKLEDAQRALETLNESNKTWKLNPSALLFTAYTGMGEREQALDWLEKVVAERSPILAPLKVDPAYDSLRNHPRFETVLRRVGLSH